MGSERTSKKAEGGRWQFEWKTRLGIERVAHKAALSRITHHVLACHASGSLNFRPELSSTPPSFDSGNGHSDDHGSGRRRWGHFFHIGLYEKVLLRDWKY